MTQKDHTTKKLSRSYMLLGGSLLMVFIIFVLVSYYKNNKALQESSLNRFQLDVANKAATLEYFFLERKYDIRNLADSQEIQTYFTNQAMGMSEEYGLKVSIFSIAQMMSKTIREKNIDNTPIYNRIEFLDKRYRLLAMSNAPGEAKTLDIALNDKIKDITQEPKIIVETTQSGHEIVFAAGCFYKKKICGWILTRLNIDTIYDHFLAPATTLSSKTFNLTLEDGTVVRLSPKSTLDFPWTEYQDTIAAITSPSRITLHVQKTPLKLLFIRIQIHPSPLYLTGYVRQDEIFGTINSSQFLAGAAAMVFIILFGLIRSVQANIKHLLLQTRLDESKKQQDTLTEKNRQLQEEIVKRKTAEKYLIENEERYRKLFEFSSDAILIMKESRILICNQKTAELFKIERSKIRQHHFYAFCPDKQADGKDSQKECLNKITQALKEPQLFEWTLQTADNTIIAAEVGMTAINLKSEILLQVLIRDITEKKHTQEILVQTEKMMAVGGLAAGMAHEINNPLGIVLQSCQNAVRRLSPALKKNMTVANSLNLEMDTMQKYLQQRRIPEYLDSIHSAGERAAQIVKSMLDFGRSSKNSDIEHCDINEILDQTINLVGSDYDLNKTYDFKKVKISRRYGEAKKIYCAKTEIGQVLLNIIKNAAQAMGATDEMDSAPEIIISTEPSHEGVIIRITDNGPGISKDLQQSIFEPFFTTKPVGEGTGLGLSVSYFIITSHHHGQISVDSKPGKGTTFIIHLPVNKNLAP